MDQDELSINLEILYQAENRIAEIIRKSELRFSTNKITGDLGEYYAYNLLRNESGFFESIEPQHTSNAEFDFLGRISNNSILMKKFLKNDIRIEVKTRRNQDGVKYLGGVKPQKFDLLCVVDISISYRLNKLFLVTSETANNFLDTKRQRLIFKESMSFKTIP